MQKYFFICIAELQKTALLAGSGANGFVIEKLYIPEKQMQLFEKMKNKGTLFDYV